MVTGRNKNPEYSDYEHPTTTETSDSTKYLGNQATIWSDEGAYDSYDITYNQSYYFRNVSISRPFRTPIAIKGTVVPAIFDSRASNSVIIIGLAHRIGLVTSGGRPPLPSLGGPVKEPCEITFSVPIDMAEKLRPDNM
ncbi:hypothetical protein J3Q64DRAFT_1819664 [Phycomyces blakesleeanus]